MSQEYRMPASLCYRPSGRTLYPNVKNKINADPHEGEVRTRTYGTPKVSKSRKTKKITFKQEINIPKIPVPAQWT